MNLEHISLHIENLRKHFRNRDFTPGELIHALLAKAKQLHDYNIWIHLLSEAELAPYLAALRNSTPEELPLYGVPFAIKDNIDLAGVPTTAACKEYAYTPAESAFVVRQLIQAGAIPLGKTNLDQFATGLVGTRSPYGACKNAFNPEYISGGSSSGSAVALAKGLVSFSLGTDTAGSGRVPAAFNNLIGLKPTKGLLSTRGVVPACRSLDCVSIFALTAEDAASVFDLTAGEDFQDAFSRPDRRPAGRATYAGQGFRFAYPKQEQLRFFGDAGAQRCFAQSIERLRELGGQGTEIDIEALLQTARLLYEGPWVAERYAAIETFIETQPQALLPVTRQIIAPARDAKATETFKAQYRLQAYKKLADAIVEQFDFVLVPTAGTIYTIAEVQAEPVALNSNLGYYTNFMNLLDYAAVAVPAGFLDSGLPFGVTLFSAALKDHALLEFARRLHQSQGLRLGATGFPAPKSAVEICPPAGAAADVLRIVVCGAHMQGLPLNHQLTERQARLVRRTTTSADYRLYALPGGPPKRPGLARVAQGGASVEVEVWEMPAEQFGSFIQLVPAPLGIGSVRLADGAVEKGFICEGYAIASAQDVTHFGGWRAYLNAG